MNWKVAVSGEFKDGGKVKGGISRVVSKVVIPVKTGIKVDVIRHDF